MIEKSEILYHYCSVDTFFNIIKNYKLWLSDIEKSNDYQECIFCREIVNERIQNYLQNDNYSLEAWKSWYSKGVETSYRNRYFGVCFSESRDQLSQWRGYAQNGKGLAIGFDKKIFEELNLISDYYIAFGKVRYNNVEDYINEIVDDNIKKFEYKGVGHIALEFSQNYRMKFPFVKNLGFEEEKEWRVVVCSPIGPYNIMGSDKISFSKIKYRSSDNKLIPYIEMSFEKIKQDIIKEIWIGPKSEVEIKDVINFLDYCGYYEKSEIGYNSDIPINIKKSSTPYR